MIGIGTTVTLKTRGAVDAFVARELAALTAAQASYLAGNGRYFQGLPTHAAPVAHTDTATGATQGTLTVTPTDQETDWATFLPAWSGQGLPARIRSDVYDGPQGKGYVLTVEATHNGVLYRRSINSGPEVYRVQPWVVVSQVSPNP